MWNLFGKKKKEGEHRTLQLITDKRCLWLCGSYKSLRTNLDFMAGSMDVHTLVITSTVPEESKSNVAVNLALTLAEKRQKGGSGGLRTCASRMLHRYLKAGHNVKGVYQRAVQPVHAGRGVAGTEGNESDLPAPPVPRRRTL